MDLVDSTMEHDDTMSDDVDDDFLGGTRPPVPPHARYDVEDSDDDLEDVERDVIQSLRQARDKALPAEQQELFEKKQHLDMQSKIVMKSAAEVLSGRNSARVGSASARVPMPTTLPELQARVAGLEEQRVDLSARLEAERRDKGSLQAEFDKSQKAVISLNKKLERETVTNRDLLNKLKLADSQIQLLKKDVAMSQRQAQTPNSTARPATKPADTDVRLQRALEELDRVKTQLKQMQQDSAHADPDRAERERLAARCKLLETQKSDLINVMRKQNKLIDILKRQKMHLEAAKLLSFAEDEFTRALEHTDN